MSTPDTTTGLGTTPGGSTYQDAARDHLWMHFTRHSVFEDGGRVPIITRGEGHRIWDDQGKEYIDGLAGLFVVNAGHGRTEIADAMARQAKELEFFPLWSYAHPRAIELAERLAAGAPGDLNRVFFTTGGGEAVETAWKLAKQYFKLIGKPTKTKVISRAIAYHGTPHGALSLTGITPARVPFEPLVPGAFKVPNTNIYRGPEHLRDDEKAFGRWAADRIEEAILFEGPESVAAVFLEPVQNSGGCFPPPAGYFERVREICDEYDVLLVSDETICAFGRIGSMFACDD
ncbi:MAG TPA: aminotransferase class III-fold pyridoxal phosphate-dependent enzyme, partial [Phycicoccus sp.]|nr:aminotransferase class III-fold pyridoxal phosphate-dependent enzyme [Phycicoccus sp.]